MKNCWFHNWSKWEQYKQPMISISRDGKSYKSEEDMQKRHCLKCGYEQREEVKGK